MTDGKNDRSPVAAGPPATRPRSDLLAGVVVALLALAFAAYAVDGAIPEVVREACQKEGEHA